MLQKGLLKDADAERLADGVLAVLERVGILCQNDELLKALAAAGAKVDFASQRVHFPKKMQAEFVDGLPSEAIVGGVSPRRDAERPWPAGCQAAGCQGGGVSAAGCQVSIP